MFYVLSNFIEKIVYKQNQINAQIINAKLTKIYLF
jgi:hypothetical protein